MKKSFKVIVAYPVYVTVEAEDQEQAEQLAFEAAAAAFDSSTIDPVIHDIQEAEE